jgi:hypothetical protein
MPRCMTLSLPLASDFMISYGMVYVQTHDIFVLELLLFWFMMEHKGRHSNTMLGWFHWLYGYT